MLDVDQIYESSNAKLVAVELDPQDFDSFFILDEEHQVIVVKDSREGKPFVTNIVDMTMHDMDMDFDYLMNRNWKSIVATRRAISINWNKQYSTSTSLNWILRHDRDDNRYIYQREQQHGTFYSLQNFKELKDKDDGARFLGCKPLPGISIVDLMGKPRLNEESTKLPFMASGNHILVQAQQFNLNQEEIWKIIVFDKDGYLVHGRTDDDHW